jgi:hypothetical protein
MSNRLVVVFAVAVGLVMQAPLVAHHTASTLYTKTAITLKGTVKSWRWSNPHCLLTFDVKGEGGQVVEWVAETQAPNTAYTQGYRASSFKPGDEVTVTMWAAANGGPFGLLTQAVLADGTKVGGQGDEAQGGRAAAP